MVDLILFTYSLKDTNDITVSRWISNFTIIALNILMSVFFLIGIFGKKRREIDAKTRACMAQCDGCKPLLLPTQEQMIKAGMC